MDSFLCFSLGTFTLKLVDPFRDPNINAATNDMFINLGINDVDELIDTTPETYLQMQFGVVMNKLEKRIAEMESDDNPGNHRNIALEGNVCEMKIRVQREASKMMNNSRKQKVLHLEKALSDTNIRK